jgi:hypothetical protein
MGSVIHKIIVRLSPDEKAAEIVAPEAAPQAPQFRVPFSRPEQLIFLNRF